MWEICRRWWLKWILPWGVVLGCSGCVGPVAGRFPPGPGQPVETVYVVNHGWHTGLVLNTEALRRHGVTPGKSLLSAPAIEFGWGDEGFYRAGTITPGLAIRAVCWPTPSVMHCVAVRGRVEQEFTGRGLIRVDLSGEGFGHLVQYLKQSFAQDEQRRSLDLGPGRYGVSRFYRGTRRYYFPNTCNRWTARALRAAGCPITPFYAVRARNVFRQTARFGTVLRDFERD